MVFMALIMTYTFYNSYKFPFLDGICYGERLYSSLYSTSSLDYAMAQEKVLGRILKLLFYLKCDDRIVNYMTT